MAEFSGPGNLEERGEIFTTKSSAAETASTTHKTFSSHDQGSLVVTAKVTAVSGTSPTLTVVVEGSTDGSNWFTLGTIGANGYAAGSTATAPTNISANGTYVGAFPNPQFVRTRSVIGGTTPSFTYSVTAQAC